MREDLKWSINQMPRSGDGQLQVMSLPNVAKARFFHSSFPSTASRPWPVWTAWPNTWGWAACM